MLPLPTKKLSLTKKAANRERLAANKILLIVRIVIRLGITPTCMAHGKHSEA